MAQCDHDWWDVGDHNPGYEQCRKCWEFRPLDYDSRLAEAEKFVRSAVSHLAQQPDEAEIKSAAREAMKSIPPYPSCCDHDWYDASEEHIGFGQEQCLKCGESRAAEATKTPPTPLPSHLSYESDQPHVLIPENDLGIKPGARDLVKLLRENSSNPEIIHFIAAMLEL